MNYEENDIYGMYKFPRDAASGISKNYSPALMGADTLIGNDVVNYQGEDLGDIKEIMLDMRNGQIAYAVLSYKKFLGISEKLFAVPWKSLSLDTENKRFKLNVEKERLKDAPGFDKDHWPNMTDLAWRNGIHTYYGLADY